MPGVGHQIEAHRYVFPSFGTKRKQSTHPESPWVEVGDERLELVEAGVNQPGGVVPFVPHPVQGDDQLGDGGLVSMNALKGEAGPTRGGIGP